MSDWLRAVLSSELFVPHGHCYLWNPSLMATQLGASALIALSCFAIAVALARLVARAGDSVARGPLLAGGVLSVTSGFTHVLDILVVWNPVYWIDAAARVVTALAAVVTVVALLRAVPKLLPKVVRAQRPGV